MRQLRVRQLVLRRVVRLDDSMSAIRDALGMNPTRQKLVIPKLSTLEQFSNGRKT